MSRMLRAALKYTTVLDYKVGAAHWIRNGRCTCGKGADCGNPGKHPRWIAGIFEHGLLSATTDPEIITALFTRFPEANIFLRPDPLSAVLDIDPRSGGDDALSELRRSWPAPRNGDLPIRWWRCALSLSIRHSGKGHHHRVRN